MRFGRLFVALIFVDKSEGVCVVTHSSSTGPSMIPCFPIQENIFWEISRVAVVHC